MNNFIIALVDNEHNQNHRQIYYLCTQSSGQEVAMKFGLCARLCGLLNWRWSIAIHKQPTGVTLQSTEGSTVGVIRKMTKFLEELPKETEVIVPANNFINWD